MSFDGDNLSRYYSAMSGPPNPVGRLRALVRTYPSALVAYSGGVDSALLAVVLRQEVGRERMVAGVGRSASYPAAQWATARAVAQRFDVPLVELDTHELEDPDYLANPRTVASSARRSCGAGSSRRRGFAGSPSCATALTRTTCASIVPGTPPGRRRACVRRSPRRD